MNPIKSINLWWRSINNRRRVIIRNTSNGKEWYTYISPIRATMVLTAIVISFFLLTLILVGHTTILEILPAYRTAADRSRDRLIENIIKIDSMERVIGQMLIYNENVGLIMEGKTPVMRTTMVSDSVKYDRTFTPASAADSALRAQMEEPGAYNLDAALSQSKSQTTSNTITFTAPIEGIITQRFDIKEGRYGVRIAATSEARIVAVEAGLVVLSLWSPENSNVVTILHPNHTISVYKNMSQSILTQGQSVKRGEIIGYNSQAIDNDGEQLFEFEMWRDGKPTNPERYIIF